jgi:hypothetical protein
MYGNRLPQTPTETKPVTEPLLQIDKRPFRSKSDQQREVLLQTQYHNLAIRAVVAAVQSSSRADGSSTEQQVG